MSKPWDGIISDEEQRAYRAAGFGGRSGLGVRPGLLIIDVQYRTTGTMPRPFWEAIKEFPTSCGQVAWNAMHNIERLNSDRDENDTKYLFELSDFGKQIARGISVRMNWTRT